MTSPMFNDETISELLCALQSAPSEPQAQPSQSVGQVNAISPTAAPVLEQEDESIVEDGFDHHGFQKIKKQSGRKRGGFHSPKAPNADDAKLREPSFGNVYNGRFREFGHGVRHYGMCTIGAPRAKRTRPAQGKGPAVEVAPITSSVQSGGSVLVTPAGTLPGKVMTDGRPQPVPSYILLDMTLLVGRNTLQDGKQFSWVKHMPDEICLQAREILEVAA